MITAFPLLREAQAALDERRYVEAAQLAMSHARRNPNEPRGLAVLGIAAMRMGALGQAEQFLRRSLALSPDLAVMRELASCLNQQERLPEALDLFERIESSDLHDPQAAVLSCLVLDKLGRSDEARARLEALLERYPAHVNAYLAYGLNLRAAGRTADAVAAYRKAAQVDPQRGDAWWGMASIKTKVLSDDDIATMEKALGQVSDLANAAPLHFALGRAWHERREHEKAFAHFSQANRLWAESIGYQAHELTEEVSETERLFDQSWFASEGDGGDPSAAPIFIVSLPRSGSTLLEQMVGSHRDIEALGELPHVPALLRLVMEDAMRRGIKSVPQAVLSLSADRRTELGREYIRRAELHRRTDAPRFIDKLPHNWSNSLLIHRMLPNAKIIDIRRNPLDCCFSNFTHSFSRVHASSFALEDIGRAYVDYVRYMAHLDQVAPGMVYRVRYEELIDDPERVLRGVMDYLGLPWDPDCLRFHESSRVVRTPSAEQVRRPLNREGVGAWRDYEQWLGPLFEALKPVLGRPSATPERA